MYWQVKELLQSLSLPLFSLFPSLILSSPARLHCQICFTTWYKRWKDVINFLYYLWIKVPIYITAVGMYIYFIPLTLRTSNPHISIRDIPLPLNSMGTLRQDRVSRVGKFFLYCTISYLPSWAPPNLTLSSCGKEPKASTEDQS